MAAYEPTIHLQLSRPIGLSLVGHRSSDGSQTTAGLHPSMHPAKNRVPHPRPRFSIGLKPAPSTSVA